MHFKLLWKTIFSSLYSAIFTTQGIERLLWHTVWTLSILACNKQWKITEWVFCFRLKFVLCSQIEISHIFFLKALKQTEPLFGVLQKFYTVSDLLSRFNIDTSQENGGFNGPNVYLCCSEKVKRSKSSEINAFWGTSGLLMEETILSFTASTCLLVSRCCSLQQKYWFRLNFQVLYYQVTIPKAFGWRQGRK